MTRAKIPTGNGIRNAQIQSAVRGMPIKNAGQSAALWTGILKHTTPLIATLDGDLQTIPRSAKLIAD